MLVFRDEVSQGVVELAVYANLNEATIAEFKNALYAELDKPEPYLRLNLDKVHSINSAAIDNGLVKPAASALIFCQCSEGLFTR